MSLLLSFALAVLLLLSLRLGYYFWEKSRRRFFAPVISGDVVLFLVEPLALNITVSRRYLSFVPNRNHRVLGRLVVQKNCVQISSTAGVLIRATAADQLEAKILGMHRVVLLGRSPSKESSLRIECAFPQGEELVQQINQALC